jgi:exodeoxyribonuclease V alpha subunit
VVDFDQVVTIRRQRFANADNGFAVVDADGDDGGEVVLVGTLSHLEARERVRVKGTLVIDSRYGEQIKVAEAHPLPPSDGKALIAYLRRVKHIGQKRAETLIEAHGVDVLDVIDQDPPGVFRRAGLSAFRAQEAAAAWHELRVTRQLHLLLAPHGLAYLVTRIHTEYGPTAHRVVATNPYELTRVFGVGFAIADRIARASLGPGADPPGRPRAGVIHVLAEAERNGSTCLPLAELEAAAAELLGAPIDDGLLDELIVAGDVIVEQEWVYRRATAEVEEEIAERVRDMLAVVSDGKLQQVDPGATQVAGGELTLEQANAVRAAFSHRLSVITGGPGTGKTATVKAIATLAEQQGAKVLLCAPTGRAAARMRETSGFDATTVHSALGWIPGEGPTHDEDDPVKCDLLILDESSMANQELMVTLLRAVAPQTHLVLVGDADQLAPVGAGKPFSDLVASHTVPSTHLNHIFRQAAASMIVQGAHAIKRGETPDFIAAEGMHRDLFMIERDDPRAALQEIVTLVCERLPAHYGVDPISEIQVFAPVYRGELGIDALNQALRAALNPDGLPVRGGRLRLGDKLMMTGRNLHELRLMNGTLLRLLDEIPAAGDDDPALLLAGDDGGVFRLPPEESESLRLAYACSVHRGQGIELPVSVIVAHPAAGAYFLRREMLYTAITRSRIATIIVGSRAVVARAARNPDTGRRHSRLGERLLASNDL